jgi:hypothetical protein
MTAYAIGNLLGRLALSYALVWFATWFLLARLNLRDSVRRTNHWSGLTATTTIFLLGLMTGAAQ